MEKLAAKIVEDYTSVVKDFNNALDELKKLIESPESFQSSIQEKNRDPKKDTSGDEISELQAKYKYDQLRSPQARDAFGESHPMAYPAYIENLDRGKQEIRRIYALQAQAQTTNPAINPSKQIIEKIKAFQNFFDKYPFLDRKLPTQIKFEGTSTNYTDITEILTELLACLDPHNNTAQPDKIKRIATLLENRQHLSILPLALKPPYDNTVKLDLTGKVDAAEPLDNKKEKQTSGGRNLNNFQISSGHNTEVPKSFSIVGIQKGQPFAVLEINSQTDYAENGSLEPFKIEPSRTENLTSIPHQSTLMKLLPQRKLTIEVSSLTTELPFIPNTQLQAIVSNPPLNFTISYGPDNNICSIKLTDIPINSIKVSLIFADNLSIPTSLFTPKTFPVETNSQHKFPNSWAELGISQSSDLCRKLEELTNKVSDPSNNISEQEIFNTIWAALVDEKIPYSFTEQNPVNNYLAATKQVLEDVFINKKGLICSTACLVLGTLLKCFGIKVFEISGYMPPTNYKGIITTKRAHSMLQIQVDGKNRVVDPVWFLTTSGESNEILYELEKKTLNDYFTLHEKTPVAQQQLHQRAIEK